MRFHAAAVALLTFIVASTPATTLAFTGEGCGSAGSCTECHNLSKKDASALLKGMVDEVTDVKLSKVSGLWSVDIVKNGRPLPVYIDFSGKYLITGNVVEIQTRDDLTRKRLIDMKRADPSVIPVEDALVFGDPKAPLKAIVFSDPECPYCEKLHHEMKKVIKERPDIAFYIKMLPLEIHPNAYEISKAIVCNKSMEILEKSLRKEKFDIPACETDVVDKTIQLAQQLGLRSTPSTVIPDGRILPGAVPADKLIKFIDGASVTDVMGKKAEK